MDNPLTPADQTSLLEDALQTYPMAVMPRDLTADVMARIQTIPAPRPLPLTRSGFVLCILLSLCAGALWFSLDHLPPLVIAQIHKESILFYQHLLVNARWWVPVISFGLAAFLAALTIPYLRQELTKETV